MLSSTERATTVPLASTNSRMVSKSALVSQDRRTTSRASDAREAVDVQVTAVGQTDRSMNLEAESAIDVATLFIGSKITKERRILRRSIQIALAAPLAGSGSRTRVTLRSLL